ncbi:MAG: hypothetical protein N3D10_01360, partial [Candidatus Micrarchaeota archaeon]|nr:hypothetical protein [Candidatus Micrarchaeota archaeon]
FNPFLSTFYTFTSQEHEYLLNIERKYHDLFVKYFSPRSLEGEGAFIGDSGLFSSDAVDTASGGGKIFLRGDNSYVGIAAQKVKDTITAAGAEAQNLTSKAVNIFDFLVNYFYENKIDQKIKEIRLSSANVYSKSLIDRIIKEQETSNLPLTFIPVEGPPLPPASFAVDDANLLVYYCDTLQTNEDKKSQQKDQIGGAYIKIGDQWFHVVSNNNYSQGDPAKNSQLEKFNNFLAEMSLFSNSLQIGVQALGGTDKNVDYKNQVRAGFVGFKIPVLIQDSAVFSSIDAQGNVAGTFAKVSADKENAELLAISAYMFNKDADFFEPISKPSDLPKTRSVKNVLDKHSFAISLINLGHKYYTAGYFQLYGAGKKMKNHKFQEGGLGFITDNLFGGAITYNNIDKTLNVGGYASKHFAASLSLDLNNKKLKDKVKKADLRLSFPGSYLFLPDGSILTISAKYPTSTDIFIRNLSLKPEQLTKELNSLKEEIDKYIRQASLMHEAAKVAALEAISIKLASIINSNFHKGFFSVSDDISIDLLFPDGLRAYLGCSKNKEGKLGLTFSLLGESNKWGVIATLSEMKDFKTSPAALGGKLSLGLTSFGILLYKSGESFGGQIAVSTKIDDTTVGTVLSGEKSEFSIPESPDIYKHYSFSGNLYVNADNKVLFYVTGHYSKTDSEFDPFSLTAFQIGAAINLSEKFRLFGNYSYSKITKKEEGKKEYVDVDQISLGLQLGGIRGGYATVGINSIGLGDSEKLNGYGRFNLFFKLSIPLSLY